MSRVAPAPRSQPWRVEADLRFDVSGPAGSTSGVVSSTGDVVRVTVDDPVAAVAALPAAPAREVAATAARAVGWLRSSGVTVDVHGPRGLLLRSGADGLRPTPAGALTAAEGVVGAAAPGLRRAGLRLLPVTLAMVVLVAVVLRRRARRAGRRAR